MGATLLEVMLAIAVATAVIVFSLKFFFGLQTRNAFEALDIEVNSIFSAMDNYYLANCSSNNADCSTKGLLSQVCTPSTSIQVVLGGGGINSLSSYLTTYPFPRNSLLNNDDTVTSNHGIVAQFKKYSFNRVPVFSQGVTTGTVVMWTEQVSVLFKNPALIPAYFNREISADCITTAASSAAQGVKQCTLPSATSGTFIAWIRIPASAGTSEGSFLPILKTFNYQYSNSELYGQNNGGKSVTSGTAYYECGL